MSENKKVTLQEFLNEKGISVEQCARDNDIPASTIYRIWKGNNQPSYAHGKKLSDYTGGKVEW